MRTWVECGFKDLKRGGFGWHHSKMREAERVERLWLAYAVALMWLVGVGSQQEPLQPPDGLAALPPTPIAHRQGRQPTGERPPRRLSCVIRGRLVLLALLLTAEAWPKVALVPERWPETLPAAKPPPNPVWQRQREKDRVRKGKQKAARSRRAVA